ASDRITAYLRFSRAYMNTGKIEESANMAQMAHRIDPAVSPFGEVLLLFPEEKKAARKFFEVSTRKNPENPQPWLYLGILAEEDGNLHKAESFYEKAKKGLRLPGEINYQKACFYSLRRQKKKALFELRKACEKDIFNTTRAYADVIFDWMRDDPFFKDELPELLKQVKDKTPMPSPDELEW
ncbi:MAG: hypothetical protein J7M18_00135, partial [Candidatus Eremiobacteraeota bacterium]|nr:hypothetical protein [Candidatus Eremiobacteraeota bacterium]